MNLPSIDQNLCNVWGQVAIGQYQTVPYYLVKATSEYRRDWSTWPNLLDSVPWKPNQGPEMRAVMTEPSPILRQTAYPELLTVEPTVDVPFTRERIAKGKVRWHDFQTPQWYFYNDFNDFLSHTQDGLKDINRQVLIYEEMFYQTYIWDLSPYVYIAGYGLVNAPTSEDGTGKNAAWLQAQIALLDAQGANGTLSFASMANALNDFEQVMGGTPFEGSGIPGKDSGPLKGKYCVVTASETWNSWTADPWVLNQRPLNMNIVNEGYYGDPFGRFMVKLQAYPKRWSIDANFSPTAPAPQTVDLDPNSVTYQRTLPNPVYARATPGPGGAVADCSPITVSYVVGGASYSKINVGPPPGDWKRINPMMDWNGKAYLTKDFLIPCKDSNGNMQMKMNDRGRYLRAQATLTCGCIGKNPFNILPILHKRPNKIIPYQSVPAIV